MRRNKGFTLIEVMVVLSILAIVAILSYNFFGSTMKEAVVTQGITKIARDLSVINDAYHEYFRKNGSYPVPDIADLTFRTSLVDTGIIKSWPDMPSIKYSSTYEYWSASDWDFTGDGINDDYLHCRVNLDACDAFNKKYTKYSAAWDYAANGNTSPVGEQMYCEVAGAKLYGTIYYTLRAN